MIAQASAGSIARSSRVRAALLKQNTAMLPPTPAARVRSMRRVAADAASRRPRAASAVVAMRSRGPINAASPPVEDAFEEAISGSASRARGRRLPTTKVPRKEADADDHGERAERTLLHGFDERIVRLVTQFRRLPGDRVDRVVRGVGVFVDEALSRLDRVVDQLLALGLDRAERAAHAVSRLCFHRRRQLLELGLEGIDFLDQVLVRIG